VNEAISFKCPPELKGVKVLTVDDDPDARLLLNTVLAQCGVVVESCRTAAEAIDKIDEFEPDILVSDIGMPDEDGYELISKIRAAENGTEKRLPAIALTAFARVEDRLKALSAGYNMHVPKPVEPAELIVVIASLLNHKRN
jgi:CheY-like chemotaxis protein